ncbi:MAG: ComC/BlpC family leader-containing pheromone/bacteriocin [Clostridium perfringens]|uniref:ComC/BlpC family leader-containing pheromone/bacteriocin n=1 Tax=Clostridium perfringens TaxID=1502 RepID=UPI001242A600|nr:ComC/BlpC family leader-containing pheromone/bacteriocin [Clostridium perfringens]MDU3584385.1 ComC/BlpC family leader-containing pheromone/bacteriocin [Clostridium butyricum]MDU6692101.1 ComC/BlpC family leader-containing pheromone/bacteriocin [Clostridium perfringens]MDU7726996.1 ComC/BlpC family leader-containing pheromone/bacteriocin [Clostridium perfringens]MDU7731849.1 ComC/BlpC family leader-containing pheromone/bacteriocin [Actinomyces sp.]
MKKNNSIKELKTQELEKINGGDFWKDLGYTLCKGMYLSGKAELSRGLYDGPKI